jgi:hypothetical protein
MTSEEKGEIYRLKELLIELPVDEQITKFNSDGVIKRLHQFIRETLIKLSAFHSRSS